MRRARLRQSNWLTGRGKPVGISAGKWNSTSQWGSFVWGRKEFWLPVEIPIGDPAFRSLMESPAAACIKQTCTVEMEDNDLSTVTDAPDVTEITVNHNLDNRSSGCTFTVADGLANNNVDPTSFYYGKLEGQLRYRFKIRVGYYISGVLKQFTIMRTLIEDSDTEWAPGGATQCTGADLSRLLAYADGTVQDYTGTLAGLVYTMLLRAGLPGAFLGFDDVDITDPTTYVSDTAGETINEALNLQQDIEIFVDQYGIFHARKRELVQDISLTVDAGQNISTKVNVKANRQGLVTSVSVVGLTAAASTVAVDAVNEPKFGRAHASISNPLITTATEADAAAAEAFSRSQRPLKGRGIAHEYCNPLLGVGRKVHLVYAGTVLDDEVILRRVTHRWSAAEMAGTTTADGDKVD